MSRQFFFFIMVRPPLDSKLFPYTTLFRSGAPGSIGAVKVHRTIEELVVAGVEAQRRAVGENRLATAPLHRSPAPGETAGEDRMRTRVNYSHTAIPYHGACLKNSIEVQLPV